MIEKKTIIYNPETIQENWKHYFKCSIPGNEYTILHDGDMCIMTDTVFEAKTNQPLYDLVVQKGDGCNILLIGWGIGFVIPRIKELAPNCNITVIEKYQQVLDLTPPDSSINIVLGDVNTVDLPEGPFDIIWSDLTEPNNREEDLKNLLTPNGILQYWRGMCIDC